MANLQKLTDITIAGESFHLAANGSVYLVSLNETDAYGNKFAVKVDLAEYLMYDHPDDLAALVQKFQDLLDYCAKLHRELQTARDRATGAGRSGT